MIRYEDKCDVTCNDNDKVFSRSSWFSSSRNMRDRAIATGEDMKETTSDAFPLIAPIRGSSLFNNRKDDITKVDRNRKWSLCLTIAR